MFEALGVLATDRHDTRSPPTARNEFREPKRFKSAAGGGDHLRLILVVSRF